ncbi:MAG: hypothetical protein WBB50_02115, partial [Methyloceanibacter sp.]
MRHLRALLSSFAFFLGLGAASTLAAAGDVITLGAAISQTGKYALNGANTKNGYDLAIKAVNEKGGIEIGGKRYDLA